MQIVKLGLERVSIPFKRESVSKAFFGGSL